MTGDLEAAAFQSSEFMRERNQKDMWGSGVPLIEAEMRATFIQMQFLFGVYWTLAWQEREANPKLGRNVKVRR